MFGYYTNADWILQIAGASSGGQNLPLRSGIQAVHTSNVIDIRLRQRRDFGIAVAVVIVSRSSPLEWICVL
jgi:hypothetical protein